MAVHRRSSLSKINEETKENTVITIDGSKKEKKEADKSLEVFNPTHTITYNTVVQILKDSYNFDENVMSTSLDILALYLKGQKIIYTESKTYCEKRLNTLMLPAILLAAVCSILNFILKDYSYGTIIISGLNATNSFILSIINYLKLAEKSQNHLMAAQRFHNLESRIELQSGRSLFFSKTTIDIEKTLEDIEKEIKEIQSSDQFIVPEAIRYRYPKIYSSNLFSQVKEIKNGEMLIINKLKTAVQDIYLYTEEKKQLVEKENDLVLRIQKINTDLNDFEVEQKMIELKMRHSGEASNDEEEVQLTDPKEMERQQYESRMQPEKMNALGIEDNLKLSKIMTSIQQLEVRKNQLRGRLGAVRETMKDIDDKIKESDEKKNKAFEATVTHRQRYIDLSDTLNREIDQHIKDTQKCGCNPCDFFNT